MTKLTTSLDGEKPQPEVVALTRSDSVDSEEDVKDDLEKVVDDDESSDDDLKKLNFNIYNEIPEYDNDYTLHKTDLSKLELTKAAEAENLTNENLYAEIGQVGLVIKGDDDRFNNPVYMSEVVLDVGAKPLANTPTKKNSLYPCKSPKTRSFYPVDPLPYPPTPAKIPEESEPSWCCGTRRRRRRSLVLGLFIFSAFLLFLCIALLVRMYLPDPHDEGEGWRFREAAAAVDGRFHAAATAKDELEYNWMKPVIDIDEQIAPATASDVTVHAHDVTVPLSEMGSVPVNGLVNEPTPEASFPPLTTGAEGISTAEFLLSTGDWDALNQVAGQSEATSANQDTPKPKTFHTESICTSWQSRRKLSLSCPDGGLINVARAFYGWSRSEKYCNAVDGDTTCTEQENDVYRTCEGQNRCDLWSDKSGWQVGCFGAHDYLQAHFWCVYS